MKSLRIMLPELNQNQWELLYRSILDVLGENESSEFGRKEENLVKAYMRNELRAEQRTQLRQLMDISEEDNE